MRDDRDRGRMDDAGQVAAAIEDRDALRWGCNWKVEKWHRSEDHDAGLAPDEVVEVDGNLLMYGGGSILWEKLIGGAGGGNVYDNTNAYLGVGDSSSAEAATQTDLQAATNKLRKAMDATYPQHTDGVDGSDHAQCVWKATFGSTDANWVWNEWALFNAAASGRMLNRKVTNLGTKASGSTWALTVTLTLS